MRPNLRQAGGGAGIGLGLWLLWGAVGVAQDFQVTEVSRGPAQVVEVGVPGNADVYYLLRRGLEVSEITVPVDVALGGPGPVRLRDDLAVGATGFYRVERVPRDQPGDTDGDGIDDVYELETPGLDPLNPTDAQAPMPGAEGASYLEYYRQVRLPLTTVEESSPYAGEDGVSVTREMVVRLTRPLAADAVVTLDQLHAEFGGRRLLGRVNVSADRRAITLFPLEPMPSSARVRLNFRPGGLRDDLGRRLDPAGTGQAGSEARIDFDTLSITPVGDTGVVGWVYASEPIADGAGGLTNLPLAGVTLTVDGAEETLRTTTDAEGRFHLHPVPAGRFFVHIDGRTATASAWPNGAYYPVVGKAWEAMAGVSTNLANGTGVIYLPLIPADALRPVSATEVTVIPFPESVVALQPEYAGVEVRVPPNALYSDSGQRGGRIGLAPVAPDRLPEPLPPGLVHVLDITVQSDGAENFDQPVPVRFPNLVDPTTGERLPPGARTALVSFNHDLGRWEVAGSMTVSADGMFLDSDEGVGVRRPGWHGWQRLTQVDPWPSVRPWWTSNPWWTVTGGEGPTEPPAPVPPGPYPSPHPQPEPPDPPQPIPPFPDFPDPPDPNPNLNDWPPYPPDSGPSGPGPEDGPDGPKPYPKGPGSGGGGVSAGPFCLEAPIEVGCINSDVWVAAAGSVAIRESGGSRFALRYSTLNGVVAAEVRALPSQRPVFTTQVQPIRPPGSVGFGPAEQAFVHVYRQTNTQGASGDEVVQLVTLQEDTQTFAPARTIVMGGSFLNASAVRFSPHGRYLVYTALKTDAHIALTVVDVATRDTVFHGSFPYYTGIVMVPPQEMVQFGPDCADRSMIFRFGDSPTSLAWHLINLERRQVVVSRRIAPGDFSSWAFTPCGDAVRLEAGAAVDPEVFATLDGAVITEASGRSLAGMQGQQEARLSSVGSTGVATSVDRVATRYSRGLHFWSLMDMLTGEVVQRGRSGASGVLMDGVLLAPNRPYRVQVLSAEDLWMGTADFVSGNVGQVFRPPLPFLAPPLGPDTDGDGLTDGAEWVVGSNPLVADSNGDGRKDGAAVRAGLSPVEGSALATGVVGSVPLPGLPQDVCAVGDRVLVALGSAGLAVLQHVPGRNPVVIGQVDTPGEGLRVACSGDWVAVADGVAGLTVLDIADPPAARVRHYLPHLGRVQAVTASGGLAFAGTSAGRVSVVDLSTGTVTDTLALGPSIEDVQWGGDRLYVLAQRGLRALRWEDGALVASGPVVLSRSFEGAPRLFVGGGYAYVTHADGYRVFDLADPDRPVERTLVSDTQLAWSQLVANGSGFGLAAAAAQVNFAREVQVYNLSDPARNDQFLTRYLMPASAQSVAIHRGQGYVATTTAGLQVLNYLAMDTGTEAPSVVLKPSFPVNPAEVEAGTWVALEAVATDDVQVRDVVFYLDDQPMVEDGSFPFEHRFFVPPLTTERGSMRLQAKATDMAGNETWSEVLTVAIVPDATPPRALPAAPSAHGFAVSPTSISVVFSEPIQAATLTSDRFRLWHLGADRRRGTDDDREVVGTTVYLADLLRGDLRFQNPLGAGRYEARLDRGLTDVAGNAMRDAVVWGFEVVEGTDADGDGLTDAFERAWGLNPSNPDENANGIPDALEDWDLDGLSNGQEMILGLDPRNPRTLDNVPDGQLDRDNDGLRDLQELELGTDWLQADTDGDGWNDEVEITVGTSPLIPNGWLPGGYRAGGVGVVLRWTGAQEVLGQGDVIRWESGGAAQSTGSADLLRWGGLNALGRSVGPTEPHARVWVGDGPPPDP